MKTSQDPRHQKRIDLMQKLFASSFDPNQQDGDVRHIQEKIQQIDTSIQSAAPEWPVEKISKIDLAILRLAVYELIVAPTEPPKVVIDEAVELAKEYGNPTSPGFINGALGAVLKQAGATQQI